MLYEFRLGQFATFIEARALILTHFSSRYETNFYESDGKGLNEEQLKSDQNFLNDEDDDTTSVLRLAAEASSAYSKGPIYLAQDYATFDLPPHSKERTSSVQCRSTGNMGRNNLKTKKNKRYAVELWMQKPMSPLQWKRLKQNVLICSKESLKALINSEQDSSTLLDERDKSTYSMEEECWT